MFFFFSSKTNPYGFASTLQHARIRITDASSSTSTDLSLMTCYFDELGNMALKGNHSRDVFQRGFVVDSKSATGMVVREKGHTNLSECIDSQKMVMNLATSQKYIKWTWFLTFTLNQKEHPGVFHLHEWKSSKNWTSYFPGYDDMSVFEKDEIDRVFEESSAPHIYSNWSSVKYLLLRHIKNHISALGTCTAIFARDEYQGDAGNVCHNHLILAIDKSTMNESTENYIQDLIRTFVFEVVKTNEDIPRLLDNGLLHSIEEEVQDIHQRANLILRHKCDERCLVRVGECSKRC